MSKRIEKVNSLLEHEIGKIILKEFNFPGTIVTLTHVDATANLIEARAYISVFPDDEADEVVRILNKGVSAIQQKINGLLNMRPIPKIIFIKDPQIAGASKVERLLEQLKKDKK